MSGLLETLRSVDLQKIEETENILSEAMEQLGFSEDDISDMKDDALKWLFSMNEYLGFEDLTDKAVESYYQTFNEAVYNAGIILNRHMEDDKLFIENQEYTGGEISLPVQYHLGDLNAVIEEVLQKKEDIIFDIIKNYPIIDESDIEISVSPDFIDNIDGFHNVIPNGYETDSSQLKTTVWTYPEWNKEIFDLSVNIGGTETEITFRLQDLIDEDEEVTSQLDTVLICDKMYDFIEDTVYNLLEHHKDMKKSEAERN